MAARSRHVTVTLTEKEARALYGAACAGQCEWSARTTDPARRMSLLRAVRKLVAAGTDPRGA